MLRLAVLLYALRLVALYRFILHSTIFNDTGRLKALCFQTAFCIIIGLFTFYRGSEMLFHPQEMQQQYEQYQALCRQLEAAQQQWQAAETLWQGLQLYYQSEQWLAEHDSDLNLATAKGEYSILGQDPLWEAMQARHERALRWIRLGLEAVEKP